MNQSDAYITVVIPCLNEQKTLEACISEAQCALSTLEAPSEVIIADNGSTDGSPELASKLGARVIHVPMKGYGFALQHGFSAAQGKYIFMADADCSYDFSEIPRFVKKLDEGFDLVVGCRFPGHGGKILKGAMPFLHEYLGNPVLSLIGRILFKARIHDFYCGLRAFRKEALQSLDVHAAGMEFALEMIVKSSLHGLRLAELPITLRPDKRGGKRSHLRTWRDGWRSLRFFLLHSPDLVLIRPACIIFSFGLLIVLLLSRNPLEIGSVGFDVSTLLCGALMIIVSINLIILGTFAKIFAVHEGILPEKNLPSVMKTDRPFEYGVALGVFSGLLGFGMLLRALFWWQSQQFGALSYQESLRVTIPAVLFIAVGVQLLSGGFVLQLVRGARSRPIKKTDSES